MSSEDQYLESFNNFIKQLKIIYIDEEVQKTLEIVFNYSDEKKMYNGLSEMIPDEQERCNKIIN